MITLVAADTQPAQPWRNGGGQTRELLRRPASGDWVLRISRADITQDGPFSAFAGVQRHFAVLAGAGVTLHFGTRSVRLDGASEALAFDGALAPGCTLLDGPTQDLNLMLRGGQGGLLRVQPGQPWRSLLPARGLYAAGPGRWSDGQQHIPISAHTLLWQDPAGAADWTFTPETDAPAFWLDHG